MKALILAAGRGKRLGDMTNGINKCMIEIRGKPLLEYNLDRVADCKNIEEIIIVVGYRANDIVDRYGLSYRNMPIKYVTQLKQHGLVHAIECSTEALDGHDFFLLLGDEFLENSRHVEMMGFFILNDVMGVCGILNQDNVSEISKTYSVLLYDDTIIRLIEKPKHPINNLQGTGHCIFKNEMLNYIKYTPIHYLRKEKELPDFIQCAVDDGKIIKTFNICDAYNNINSESDMRLCGVISDAIK